jgi:hypothetical protein
LLGNLRSWYWAGRQVTHASDSRLFFDSVLDCQLPTDARDDWTGPPTNYTIYIPNRNGQGYKVVFTDRIRPRQGAHYKRFFLQRMRQVTSPGYIPFSGEIIIGGLGPPARLGQLVQAGLSTQARIAKAIIAGYGIQARLGKNIQGGLGTPARTALAVPGGLATRARLGQVILGGGAKAGVPATQLAKIIQTGTSYMFRVPTTITPCCVMPIPLTLTCTVTNITNCSCWTATSFSFVWNNPTISWRATNISIGCGGQRVA